VSTDVVFAYPKVKTLKNTRSIGISVVDVKWRNDVKIYEDRYLEFLTKIIVDALNENYNVNLYSFCDSEGDLSICRRLRENLSYVCTNTTINVINYSNDIDDFVSSFCSNVFIVATRFHAVVLSILNNVPVFPIAYMNKIDNFLSDINFKGLHFSLHEKNEIDWNLNLGMLLNQKIEYDKLYENSQFLMLDLILR